MKPRAPSDRIWHELQLWPERARPRLDPAVSTADPTVPTAMLASLGLPLALPTPGSKSLEFASLPSSARLPENCIGDIDSDGSGSFSVDELLAVARSMRCPGLHTYPTYEADLRFSFHIFDRDGDGEHNETEAVAYNYAVTHHRAPFITEALGACERRYRARCGRGSSGRSASSRQRRMSEDAAYGGTMERTFEDGAKVTIVYSTAGTVPITSIVNVPIPWQPGKGVNYSTASQLLPCAADEDYYGRGTIVNGSMATGPGAAESATYQAQLSCLKACLEAGAKVCANTCAGCWAGDRLLLSYDVPAPSYVQLGGDCPGYSLRVVGSSLTVPQCEAACDQLDTCAGFSFAEEPGECQLAYAACSNDEAVANGARLNNETAFFYVKQACSTCPVVRARTHIRVRLTD